MLDFYSKEHKQTHSSCEPEKSSCQGDSVKDKHEHDTIACGHDPFSMTPQLSSPQSEKNSKLGHHHDKDQIHKFKHSATMKSKQTQ